MAIAGIYQRVLPCPPAIEFSSAEGKNLFSEALSSGTLEGFFKLISYFQTQSEPAFCGLASLSVVLNALAIDPGRTWKGPWRWFDESMLDCCEPLDKIKVQGITFRKVACLASCAGANVEAFHTNQSTIEHFRNQVMRCASSEDCHLITSYHRALFKQTGSGHFSPVGGYHIGKDMVLILDVARFKYPPHWVPLSLLWKAMDTVDAETGCYRGFMLISRLSKGPSLLYTLSCKSESWVGMTKYLTNDVPVVLKSENPQDVPSTIALLLKSLPSSVGDFIKWTVEVRRREEGVSNLSAEEKERLSWKEKVMQQVRSIELFKVIQELLCSERRNNINLSSNGEDAVMDACCQGAAILSGNHATKDSFLCCKTCVNHVKNNGDRYTAVISATVLSNGSEQGIDVLVPSPPKSSCGLDLKQPTFHDILTILLLALPADSWSSIRDKALQTEIERLVSTESLPDVLQQEVLHLRRQLLFLKDCKDKEGNNGLATPL